MYISAGQESLKDEVFQERIFAWDVNEVVVRDERHSFQSGSGPFIQAAAPCCCECCGAERLGAGPGAVLGVVTLPAHSLSLQTEVSNWGKVSGPPP